MPPVPVALDELGAELTGNRYADLSWVSDGVE